MPENEALVSSALHSKRPLLSEIEVKHTCDSIASVVVEECKSLLAATSGETIDNAGDDMSDKAVHMRRHLQHW